MVLKFELEKELEHKFRVAAMKNYGIEKLASLDKHFDKIRDR